MSTDIAAMPTSYDASPPEPDRLGSRRSSWNLLRSRLADDDVLAQDDIDEALEYGSDEAVGRLAARVAADTQIRLGLLELHWGPHQCRELPPASTSFADRVFHPGSTMPGVAGTGMDRPCQTLRMLLAPYSDQPGFLDEWRL